MTTFAYNMAETISVRIGKEELSEIGKLSKQQKRTKSDILREVLERGIREKRLELALESYRNNEATASKAAETAGISLSRFLDILFEKKIEFHYTLEDFREDIKALP